MRKQQIKLISQNVNKYKYKLSIDNKIIISICFLYQELKIKSYKKYFSPVFYYSLFIKKKQAMFKKLMKQVEKQAKKITKQIQRPFQYAQKAGQSQTHELNREQIGMQITGCQTGIKLQDCQTIQISNFASHLQSKQLPATALFFFKTMKNVQVGKRDQKDFVLRIQTAFLQSIGMAVKRENQTTIKVAIVWKTYTVNYTEPKTKINYRTSQYGLGWRDSTDHSETTTKQLTDSEIQQLRNRLQSQAEKLNAASDANAMLD